MLALTKGYISRRYLIIGGTGSLGQTLVQELLKQGILPEHITVLSRDEQKQHEMRKTCPNCRYIIHDIRECDGLQYIVDKHDVIINTAAMKHIYVCQDNVYEAVRTNVMGQYNVLRAISECAQRKIFIGISTDKAPQPTTQYGATKMLGEGLVKNFAKDFPQHLFFACRYGNVALSRGSVVPIFISRARQRAPLSVTHPQMTRFLMSLEEAVCLVLATLLYNADIPSGAVVIPMLLRSCYVLDLARAIQEYCGSNAEIFYTGPGQGEKLHEVLVTEEEAYRNNLKIFYKENATFEVAYISPVLSRSGYTFSYASNNEDRLLKPDAIVPFLKSKGVQL